MSVKYFFIILLTIFITLPFDGFASEEKPFAEKYVVLQISDPNPFKQTLVLNVASNILKHYGSDKVDIEIVTLGQV